MILIKGQKYSIPSGMGGIFTALFMGKTDKKHYALMKIKSSQYPDWDGKEYWIVMHEIKAVE